MQMHTFGESDVSVQDEFVAAWFAWFGGLIVPEFTLADRDEIVRRGGEGGEAARRGTILAASPS